MTTAERFHAVMNFKRPDRLPVLEWAGYWNLTRDRWLEEGIPAELKDADHAAWCRYFGMDVYRQAWYRSIDWRMPRPDRKERGAGQGLINDMADYERLHEYFFNSTECVNKATLEAWAGEREQGEAAIWFTLDGFFWLPRVMLGDEEHLYALYDDPALIHRINSENAQWMLKIIDEVCTVVTPDFMTFAEDMSYNHGPMLSEEHFDEYMLPYYRQVIPALKQRGIRVFTDSDGDITRPAGWFERAGIEGILPLEAQSGVDMAVLRREHPKQCYLGGFDKMKMPLGEAAMRAEFERLMPIAQQGGYIISCDHQTPPGVSLENYRIYLELFREYAVKGTGNGSSHE